MPDRIGGPAGGHRPHLPPDCIIVDPLKPCVRAFLFKAIAVGAIRTVPAGPGRIAILPLSVQFQHANSLPDVLPDSSTN